LAASNAVLSFFPSKVKPFRRQYVSKGVGCAKRLHVRDKARSADRAFLHPALVSSQNQPSPEPDLPPPAPGVSRKGRLLPHEAPFPFLGPWPWLRAYPDEPTRRRSRQSALGGPLNVRCKYRRGDLRGSGWAPAFAPPLQTSLGQHLSHRSNFGGCASDTPVAL
jgi:hypothetical protein